MPTPARVVVCPAEPGPLRIDEIALPDPGPHQVVVKQFASGICHSQLHQMHGPRGAPQLLGHESTGTVVAAGSEVSHVKEGDRVMVTWVPRSPDLGRRPNRISLELADGSTAISQGVFTWADNTIADEQYIVSMPEDIRTDVTAIIGCAIMTGSGAAYHTAGVKQGESVAVFGVGGVGLSAIVAAAVIGADPIIAVDLSDEKLEFAKKFGATIGVNASDGDAVEQVRALTTQRHRFRFHGPPPRRRRLRLRLHRREADDGADPAGGAPGSHRRPHRRHCRSRGRSPDERRDQRERPPHQREEVHRQHRRLLPARP